MKIEHAMRLKPYTTNSLYYRGRVKRRELRQWEDDCALLLPGGLVVPDGELELDLIVGLRGNADSDNAEKTFVDALARKYGFNDHRIHSTRRVKVKDAAGFIGFSLRGLSAERAAEIEAAHKVAEELMGGKR